MKDVLISSGVLILLICLIRALLKNRASARLRYALWGLVLLRLLVPVSLFASPVSAPSIYERSELSQAMVPTERVTLPYVAGVNGSVAPEDNPVTQKREAGEEVPPFQVWIRDEDTPTPETEYIFFTPLEELAAKYLPPVWIGGAALMALWFLVSNLRFRLRLRRSRVSLETPEGCTLPVYVSGCVASPCMVGLFRPAVYLTREAAEDPQKRSHVLAHELTHFRHGDHVWSFLRALCLVAYWWNPLVWLAAALSRTDCELACDEGTVARLGEEARRAYGHTLLDMAVLRQGPDALLRVSTSIGAGKQEMRRRISALAAGRVRLTALAALLLLLAVGLFGCSFAGTQETASVDPGDVTPSTPPLDIQTQPGTDIQEGSIKEILTFLYRDGDALICTRERGEDNGEDQVRVRVNGLLTEDELAGLERDCLLVVTYDEETDGEIGASTLQIGVRAEDLPETESMFTGCTYSVFSYADGQILAADGLDGEADQALLMDVFCSSMLSSTLHEAVGLGALTECYVLVLHAPESGTSAFAQARDGVPYYVYQIPGEGTWIQPESARLRSTIRAEAVRAALEERISQQGVPLAETALAESDIPFFGCTGDFTLLVGGDADCVRGYIEPVSVFRNSCIWTESGWLAADGGIEDWETLVSEMPTVEASSSLNILSYPGFSNWTQAGISWKIYTEDMELCDEAEGGALSSIQPPPDGTYIVLIDVSLRGRYVDEAQDFEYENRSYYFKWNVG